MTNLFDIAGDVAVVTGAGRGIGRGVAEALANPGAFVVCVALRENVIERWRTLRWTGSGDSISGLTTRPDRTCRSRWSNWPRKNGTALWRLT